MSRLRQPIPHSTTSVVDYHTLLAWTPGGAVVGHTNSVRLRLASRGEVAVQAADDLHRPGLATPLLLDAIRRRSPSVVA